MNGRLAVIGNFVRNVVEELQHCKQQSSVFIIWQLDDAFVALLFQLVSAGLDPNVALIDALTL